MELVLEDLTKKFPKNKLFTQLNYTFETDQTYAITGENGSGKSTLLNIIAGFIPPTSGKVTFLKEGTILEKDNIYKLFGITAPYIDLIEELTLEEHLTFHSKFKEPLSGIEVIHEIEQANLTQSLQKPVGEFSSGMKQRLKLILCCNYQSEILLLDEPTSHLDSKGIIWYKDLLKRTTKGRITLIASNDPSEYDDFAGKIINIGESKKNYFQKN